MTDDTVATACRGRQPKLIYIFFTKYCIQTNLNKYKLRLTLLNFWFT